MKNNNKIKNAFSLVEVMIFFLVTSIVLVITVPIITTQKAQDRCVPGGRIVFDGTDKVYGDTTNLEKVICEKDRNSQKRLCSYLWKAPVKNVYVTVIGGGGGGSGAFMLGANELVENLCNDAEIDASGKCVVDNTVRARPKYSTCPSNAPGYENYNECSMEYWEEMEKEQENCRKRYYTLFGRVYMPRVGTNDERNYKQCVTNAANRLISMDEYRECFQYGDEVVDLSPGSYGYCVTEQRRGNKTEPCSLEWDDSIGMGKEVVGGVADCFKQASAFGGAGSAIGGSGGMGGHYVFGPNFYPPIYDNAGNIIDPGIDKDYDAYKRNLSKPMYLTVGKNYKIIVGAGGKGGPFKAIHAYIEATIGGILTHHTSGQNGGDSCIIDPNNCDSCAECSRRFLYAKASGGYGAWGHMSYYQRGYAGGLGYRLSPRNKDSSKYVYYTQPFDPYYSNQINFPSLGAPSHPEIYYHLTAEQYKQAVMTIENAGENVYMTSNPGHYNTFLAYGRQISKGFAAQKLGEQGGLVIGGKGGGSLYGTDRWGAGGDGGWLQPGASAAGLIAGPPDGKDGKNGMIEIRWFSQCE